MLAMPNESRGKTIAMAFVTAAICAVLVTVATVLLRPIQAQNRAAEEQARMESLLAAIPGMTDLLAAAGESLSTVVIDLDTGHAAEGVTPETLPAALNDQANWSAIPPQDDAAGIGTRPDLAQIFILRESEEIRLLILPVVGSGYGGPIEAMLALEGDLKTLAGMTVTRQSETPGLGARIEEPAWQAQFAGRPAVDAAGTPVISVARGAATSEYEVDGITGATRTVNGVNGMIRYWLGPDGYGPLLDAIRRREF